MNSSNNKFADYLKALEKDKLVYIYLTNNVVILTKPKDINFFGDYFICNKISPEGTIYFPDQNNIYPSGYEKFNQAKVPDINTVPYSAICLITSA